MLGILLEKNDNVQWLRRCGKMVFSSSIGEQINALFQERSLATCSCSLKVVHPVIETVMKSAGRFTGVFMYVLSVTAKCRKLLQCWLNPLCYKCSMKFAVSPNKDKELWLL